MTDLQALNAETHNLWNRKAEFWDERMAEGNDFQKILVGPASERLLNLQPDELILEIACGNGVFARRVAQLGARVVACDFSEKLIELAKARTAENAERISYQVIDATNEAQLLTLGERRFDAIVCNMALMDIATIQPLMNAVSKLLKVGGRFVFSQTHPCFNTAGIIRTAELEEKDGQITTIYSLKISQYLSLTTTKGSAMPGDPAPHYYFDRPLSSILTTCFKAGLVMDGLEEPSFGSPTNESQGSLSLLNWKNYREFPPVLVARLRLISQ